MSVRSIAVSVGQKCALYSTTEEQILCNLQLACDEFILKGYPSAWWRRYRFRGLTRGGIISAASGAASMTEFTAGALVTTSVAAT